MSTWEIFAIAIGLAMDALAVAICRGLKNGRVKLSDAFITALFFGGFQALMPLLGYLLGSTFESYITAFDHWIAFVLLAIIGINMIKEASSDCHVDDHRKSGILNLILLAIATSIDALAIGVTFAFLKVNVVHAVAVIGGTAFVLSFIGVGVGSFIGAKFKKSAEIFGGIILIGMGTKILIEHLFFA